MQHLCVEPQIISNLPATGCLMCALPGVQFPNGIARNMEDLKARYYSIARQLMVAREGGQEDIENRTLIKQPFDAAHERCRLR